MKTHHESWALQELERIAKTNASSTDEVISVDSLIRLSVSAFIISHHKNPVKITQDLIKDRAFEARKMRGN